MLHTHTLTRYAIVTLLLLNAACSRSASSYVSKGNQLFEHGKFEEASLNYRKAIQLNANYGPAFYGLAMSSLKSNKPADVLPNLTRAVDLSPNDKNARAKLADLLLSLYLTNQARPKAKYDQVSVLADKMLAEDPNSYDGHRLRGYLAFEDRKSDEALNQFQAALRAKPNDLDAGVMIAQITLQQGNAEVGEHQIRAIVESHPDYGPAYDLLYSYLESKKQYSDAEAVLQLKSERNPNQPHYGIQLAQHYQRRGDSLKRDAVLDKIAANPKNFPEAALAVGAFDVGIGEWKNALNVYRRGLEAQPDHASVYLRQMSAILITHQEARTALDLVEHYFSANRSDPALKALRAGLIVEVGDRSKLPEALAALLDLEKLEPKNAEVHFELGRAYLLEGKLNNAQAQLRDSVKLDSGFLEPRLALILLAINTRQYYDALRQCDEVLQIANDNVAASVFRAASLSGLGRYKEARSTLTELLKKSAKTSDVELELGYLSLAEKKYPDAERTFRQRYTPGDQNIRPLAGLASALERQGHWDAAVALVEKDLSANPGRPFVSLMLAQIVGEKDIDKAIGILERLVVSAPQFSPAFLALGELYLRHSEPEKAVGPLQRGRDLEPTNTALLTLLSGALDRAGQPTKAKAVYAEWLKLDPDNPIALNNLAYLDCSSGNLDEALQLAGHALQKAPKDPNISDTLGWVYLKKHQYTSARAVLQPLAKRFPKNAVYRYHNGLASLESGDRQGAKIELAAALANNPTPEVAGQIRNAMGRSQIDFRPN